MVSLSNHATGSTLPPLSPPEQHPVANHRPPRPHAPHARRLHRRDANPCARSHPHLDAYPYADSYSNPYADTYPYSHSDARAHCNAYSDCNAQPHSYGDADSLTNPHPHSFSGGGSRAALQPR